MPDERDGDVGGVDGVKPRIGDDEAPSSSGEPSEVEPSEVEPVETPSEVEPIETRANDVISTSSTTEPVESELPPTSEEGAAAVLDVPAPAQSALPLPLVPPVSAAQAAVPAAIAAPPLQPDPAAADTPTPAAPARPARRAGRTVLWIGAVLVALAALVGLFFLGQRLAGGNAPAAVPTATASPTPSPSPTPTPTPTPTPIVGPQPAGAYAWDELGGGECLEPYVSPWEEEFTVVDCAVPHTGQLVYRGAFAGDTTTPFPGEAALASQINLLCSAPGVIDLAAARAFPDVQLQGSFPVTAEQWTTGQRYYYCFVSRSGGEPLTSSIAGPGPVAAG